MTESSPASAALEELVGQVADEIMERRRRGERPDVEEYAARHPEIASVLRDMFPALLEIGQLGSEGGAASRAAQPGSASGVLGDFRILREIGRGGMGIVYEAEQISLGRRVALKVLPWAATMDSRQLARFHNEARAAAGLHHTNIVPVHYVGSERGTHYYAMQFIDGRDLASVIAQLRQPSRRSLPDSRDVVTVDAATGAALPPSAPAAAATTPLAGLSTERSTKSAEHFRAVARLGIQAAEALDHAHQMGIVHRDVKPANLLVDDAGRLWITDFGLAQFQSDTRLTMTGDLVGTLRYMSPEQALAKRVVIDHRTDVYSLGATLYELLTMRPAFEGQDRQELLRQIAFEEPRPPRRLERAVPAELETIVLKALEKNPADRYASAQEMAGDLRNWLEDRPIKARRPSLWQVAARWGRRHRTAVTAAAVCLLVALAAAIGSGSWVLGEQRARQREAEARAREALAKAMLGLRRGNPQDAALVQSVQQAKAQLGTGVVGPALRGRVEQLLRDWEMLGRLDEARLQRAAGSKDEGLDYAGADRLYAKAFACYGLDAVGSGPEEAAAQVRASAISSYLIAGLIDWAAAREQIIKGGGAPLGAVAYRADDDPWRRRWFLAAARINQAPARAALAKLAREEGARSQPPAFVVQLARTLRDAGSWEAAEELLRRALADHPGDFWINFDLGYTLSAKKPSSPAEAVRFYQAALALRPQSPLVWDNLGIVLRDVGKPAEAEAAHRKALALQPDIARAYNHLGNALRDQGKPEQAEAEHRKAIKLQPDFAEAHGNLGIALLDQRKVDEAEAAFRKAIKLKPDLARPYSHLGAVYREKGKFAKAIDLCQKAIKLQPEVAAFHFNLGIASHEQRNWAEAEAAYRQAIKLQADHARAHHYLGRTLREKGLVAEAVLAYQKAIWLKKDDAEAHYDLGAALAEQRKWAEAEVACRMAIQLKRGYAEAHFGLGIALSKQERHGAAAEAFRRSAALKPWHRTSYNLGNALWKQGKLAEAEAAFRDAVKLKPDYAEAHCNLGHVLRDKGLFRQAVEELRHGHKLGSRGGPNWKYPSAQWLQHCERLAELDCRLPAILSGEQQPADTGERLTLAELCRVYRQRHAAAVRFYEESFAAEPRLADDLRAQARYNAACSAALAGCGQGKDAATLGPAEPARLRRQALDWLRADLTAWSRLLDQDAARARPVVVQQMRRWQGAADFAGVRGEAALAGLPEQERPGWQQLWADVAATLARAGGQALAEKKPVKK
jgi:serine/threonine protein kinase/Flp pilus assembly protein TadD